ncbi:MAG: F0F1 ATP synthase subunit alpha, partial [Acidimicrobiales bacterium]
MADLNIDTTDITAALRKNLDGYTPDLSVTQVGRVLEVGDGIARVSGLPDCAVNELLEFDGGTVGLALNLDEESIGAVILGEGEQIAAIEEGSSVQATGRIQTVPVGDA